MILSVTLNPSVDNTLYVDGLSSNDTNRVLKAETDAGGKGVNLSRVAAALGAETVATGFLGGKHGAFVCAVLDLQGVKHGFVQASEETRTNFSVEDGSGMPPTTFNAKGPSIDEREWNLLVDRISDLASGASWVTLGGSLPPGVPVDAYKTLCEIAKKKGAKVALDADGEPLRQGLEGRPHFFKPNGREAGRLLGRTVESVDDAIFAAEELRQYLEDKGICVVSLGADGAVMACGEGTFVGKGIEVEAKSTIGSGDSMVAAMLVWLERGGTAPEALKAGLAAGAATAMTDGAEIAGRSGIEALLPLALVERVH